MRRDPTFGMHACTTEAAVKRRQRLPCNIGYQGWHLHALLVHARALNTWGSVILNPLISPFTYLRGPPPEKVGNTPFQSGCNAHPENGMANMSKLTCVMTTSHPENGMAEEK